jgi:hypothetical protein
LRETDASDMADLEARLAEAAAASDRIISRALGTEA